MSDMGETSKIARGVLKGSKAAVSQALNLVEDRRGEAQKQVAEILSALGPGDSAKATQRVGLTGPPGVGKSTLVATLARALRGQGRTVGVVAVDPSSVWSGGSLLGDRARMGFDPTDDGFFVRSLATAGELGGLAYAANSAVRVLSAAYDTVLVETTGVGQTETDVMHVADTVVLVIQPGSGDVLQFLKAGIMEIPDILVVNKADQEDLARRAVADLKGALTSIRAVGAEAGQGSWQVPVLAASAKDGTGIEVLIEQLDAHMASIQPELSERRSRGELEWALQLFERKHGEHGVQVMGGRQALSDRTEKELRAGENPLSLCEKLSADYLLRLNNPK